MDLSLISPLINAGYSTLFGGINAEIQNDYFERQSLFNYDLNEKSADNAMRRSYKMFSDLQSPSAIKAQLEKAGLNPALMYSNGSSMGQVTQAPQGGAVPGQGVSMLGLQELTNPLTMAQIENIKADTNLKNEQSNKTKAETAHEALKQEYTIWQTNHAKQDFQFNSIQYGKTLDAMDQNLKTMLVEYDILVSKREVQKETAQIQIQSAYQEYVNLVWQGAIQALETQKMQSVIKNIDADTRNKTAENELIKANTAKVKAETQKEYAQIKEIFEHITKMQAEGASQRALKTYYEQKAKEIDLIYGDDITKQDIKFGLQSMIQMYEITAKTGVQLVDAMIPL